MYKYVFNDRKAIIFDLEGTVLVDDSVWKSSFVSVGARLGYYGPAYEPSSGITLADAWKNAQDLKMLDHKLRIDDLVSQVYKEYLANLSLVNVRDGFFELVAELRVNHDYKVGLITGNTKSNIPPLLKALGLENVFDTIVYESDVSKPRPNSEIFVTAAQNLGIAPDQCLVFDHTVNGAKAALDANMPCFIIWNGVVDRFDFPQPIVAFLPDFEGLSDLVDYDLAERVKELPTT
ncbi:HAD family phosphatase [candidate division WWE3 bacterium]|uniref:HAD family phosphatase n=1 Tax=candidate division WWE3 bacterium TaxID=2053526 RepID=A0A955EB43_UNCKA|nr:HAD family phosphatase [candidate division WWE3 bacterium]